MRGVGDRQRGGSIGGGWVSEGVVNGSVGEGERRKRQKKGIIIILIII